MRRAASLFFLLPALAICQTNLAFSDGRPGEAPPGWFVADGLSAGFHAFWQHEGCQGAAPCVVLSAPSNAGTENSATLMQSFPAQSFRGQTVHLRAWIKLEKKGPSDHAQMLVRVSRPGFQQGFFDNMANRPIVSGVWAPYEIHGTVAADAETIQVGLSLYGSGRVWIGDLEFGAVDASTDTSARDAIEKQYARMDSAFARKDGATVEEILMPGAQMGVGSVREPLLPAIQSEMSKGPKLATHTELTALRMDGDEAVAMVRREAKDQSNPTRSVVTSHRDTWIRTSAGWRWRESIEVSYHWILPPTSAESARTVVAELKSRAVPLSGADDLTAFGAAVGDARIVALGEAAQGTREFADWKQRLVEYLAAKKGFTLLIASKKDADVQQVAERLHMEFVGLDTVSAEGVAQVPNLAQVKAILWTDNTHARDPQLREKFGRRLYVLGFAFDRGEVKAVGVEKGEWRGLGVYRAPASPEGSGDAVLNAAGMPQFFLNFGKLPPGALSRWMSEMHLVHDLGAYWVLDDPEASLQPEELALCYDGLLYVEEVHAS